VREEKKGGMEERKKDVKGRFLVPNIVEVKCDNAEG
jgi:hypothetical protein